MAPDATDACLNPGFTFPDGAGPRGAYWPEGGRGKKELFITPGLLLGSQQLGAAYERDTATNRVNIAANTVFLGIVILLYLLGILNRVTFSL